MTKKTEEACLEHISNGAVIEDDKFKYIPERLINKKICEKAFQTDVRTIRGIPEEFVTKEMLLEAAKQYPGLLWRRIPERLKTEAFCRKLVEINPAVEEYI